MHEAEHNSTGSAWAALQFQSVCIVIVVFLHEGIVLYATADGETVQMLLNSCCSTHTCGVHSGADTDAKTS